MWSKMGFGSGHMHMANKRTNSIEDVRHRDLVGDVYHCDMSREQLLIINLHIFFFGGGNF